MERIDKIMALGFDGTYATAIDRVLDGKEINRQSVNEAFETVLNEAAEKLNDETELKDRLLE